MFDGLKTMDKLVSDEKDDFVNNWKEKLSNWKESSTSNVSNEELPHSDVKPVTPPTPPKLNEVIRLKPGDFDLHEIWNHLNKKSLFKLSWGIKGNSKTDSIDDPEKLLEEWKQRVLNDNLFEPQAVYGLSLIHI